VTVFQATFDMVADRIASALSVPRESVLPGAHLKEIAPDSLALIELIVDLQEEFDIILSHEQIDAVQTIGDLLSVLQAQGE
jgi:acyl carrier protein